MRGTHTRLNITWGADRWRVAPLAGFAHNALLSEFPQMLRVVVSRQWREITLLNRCAQDVQAHLVAVKWRLQRSHLQRHVCIGARCRCTRTARR